MTEKRFWILNTLTKCSGIKDKDKLLTFDEVVDLLNELNEENERLKEYKNKLMKQPLLFDVQTIPNTMEIIEANIKLEKENEQLKQQIEIYDKFLDENDLYFSWSNFCTIDECVHNKEFDCKYCSYIGGKK